MKKLLGILTLSIATLGLTGCFYEKVETGHVGVAWALGKMKTEELSPGIHQTFTQSIKVISVRETTVPLANLKPKTKDNVTMQQVAIDVRYTIAPNRVAETLAKLAGDLSFNADGDQVVGERYVKRHAQEAIFKAVAKFDSGEIHKHRDEIAADVVTELQKSLNKEMPGVFHIPGATVRSLTTDPRLEEAIRQAAQVQFEINRAEGQKALALAQAEVRLTTAKAEADANRVIAASLSPMLIRKMEIDAQQAFAGKGTHTVLMGNGSATPLLNVK
ncbi:SPFH domain-containing protein [Acinetobacter sp. A47]|uniref:SPFH domain-containing protein n=1 Tax=Acinetobacter sp. A47 TaxID=1561217 RepID=UPI00056E1F64|nr:SPFH domain-containing protein [Acinetobacter sp. A47]